MAALALAAVLGAGCGADAASVQEEFAAYLDREGISAEVMDGGCLDAYHEENGLALWKCVVYRGDESETWNVAFDGESVVDASQER